MQPTPNITIQFIEFTYYNGKFLPKKVIEKETKYVPLIRDIQIQGWTIMPLIVITVGARGAIHQNTKTQLIQCLLRLKNTNTKNTKTLIKMLLNFSCTSFLPKEEMKANNHFY